MQIKLLSTLSFFCQPKYIFTDISNTEPNLMKKKQNIRINEYLYQMYEYSIEI